FPTPSTVASSGPTRCGHEPLREGYQVRAQGPRPPDGAWVLRAPGRREQGRLQGGPSSLSPLPPHVAHPVQDRRQDLGGGMESGSGGGRMVWPPVRPCAGPERPERPGCGLLPVDRGTRLTVAFTAV